MRICRRLFVVPLADNDHGKTTIIRALVSQGMGRKFQKQKKGVRELVTPYGRTVDAYVFGRSYQEVEKGEYGSVIAGLDANDADWRRRELIIMPNHISDIGVTKGKDDIDQIVEAAHGAGFDAICASVAYGGNFETKRARCSRISGKEDGTNDGPFLIRSIMSRKDNWML
jgi:hypothetical protein